jgi:hypothetical protein
LRILNLLELIPQEPAEWTAMPRDFAQGMRFATPSS